MANIYKDFKINDLIENYNRYSIFFNKYQNHIESCFNNHIINIIERNNFLKTLSNIIQQFNNSYNTEIVNLQEEDFSNFSSIKFPIRDPQDIKDLIDLHKNIPNNNSRNIISYQEPFSDIKDLVINKLTSQIGFPSIKIGISFIFNKSLKNMFDQEVTQILFLYNQIFIPLKFSTSPSKSKSKFIKKIFIKKTGLNNDLMIQHCADLYIKLNGTYLIFSGYLINDALNLISRTAQISNSFFYEKKKNLEKFVLSKKEINDKFIKTYIRNSPIVDFLALSNIQFYNQLKDDYKFYNKIIKMSFMNLMKEYIKDSDNNNTTNSSLNNMYRIIKLLLLGSQENINIAGLLYGVSKEKKTDNDFSIAEIIYKNLSYLCQIKLRKSAVHLKNELDKLKTIAIEDIDLKKQIIVSKNMPNNVKKAALEKIEEMKASNNEYYKQLMYVRTLLNFPWCSPDDDNVWIDIGSDKSKSKLFLNNIINKLNSKVYGHTESKEAIKELIGKWLKNPSSAGSAIGISGPPGIGKTLLAKAIGEALDIPFVQISLGGQNDGELLHGHGYTYSGSQPGMIVKKMVEAGSSRCLMYFDELDKACKKNESNEIHNILIHITDPNTNNEFQDRFFQEITFPLNKVLFIFSYNNSDNIDNILMDRINKIEVKPFKLNDKKIILKTFLIKEMCELIGFEQNSVLINEEDMDFIINQYTNEPGVRELKRKLEKIFLKLNIDKIYNTNCFEKINEISKNKPIILNKSLIENYLGKNNNHIQYINENNLVGVINGLYATDSGQGGILPIQIFNNFINGDDKFTLKLTGSQKRVMRESVITAFTSAIHCITPSIREAYFHKNLHGFHIHAPSSAATPKDGPSGGGAFACAFVSRILNKKIKNNIAITGEIELTGKVSKIGGLQYKLVGAKKAGIKLVLVPIENKEDVTQIEKEYNELFDENFKVILVDNLTQILEHVLIDFDPTEIIKN